MKNLTNTLQRYRISLVEFILVCWSCGTAWCGEKAEDIRVAIHGFIHFTLVSLLYSIINRIFHHSYTRPIFAECFFNTGLLTDHTSQQFGRP